MFRKSLSKKAQGSLEFLVTYGWAFVVVLVLVGGMTYFGVIDTSNVMPDAATFPTGSGVVVNNMIVQSDGVVLFLKNSRGDSVYDLRVGMQHCSGVEGIYAYSPKIGELKPNSVAVVKIGCPQGYAEGASVRQSLRMVMKTVDGGFDHVYMGSIKFKVRTSGSDGM